MSAETELERTTAPVEAPAAEPAGNPALLGLMTLLPSGITLGLWFVGYLDTTTLAGGMIPTVALSAGLFQLIAAVWAARLAANTVAAIFGVFAAFWLSFGLLLMGATSGWWGITADNLASVQSTYLLSFLLVFILLTLATLRLPLVFTAGFVFVVATFALAYLGVSTGSAGLFPIAGITTFIFCAIFAYVLVDGINQDLGGTDVLPMGNPMLR
jgi:succinate-acetate transporter protein